MHSGSKLSTVLESPGIAQNVKKSKSHFFFFSHHKKILGSVIIQDVFFTFACGSRSAASNMVTNGITGSPSMILGRTSVKKKKIQEAFSEDKKLFVWLQQNVYQDMINKYQLSVEDLRIHHADSQGARLRSNLLFAVSLLQPHEPMGKFLHPVTRLNNFQIRGVPEENK